MPVQPVLSWNEIRARATQFARDWADETSEDAEAKSFWDKFFEIFGINRRRVATFEQPVKKSDGHDGYIDLLWKGKLLVEHKSKGKSLDKAAQQARDYFPGLKDRDLPRYIVVTNFEHIRLYDLDNDATHEFALHELPKHIKLFGFIAGYESKSYGKEAEVSIKAAYQLGQLHDLLEDSGYTGEALEVLMVRLLFCMFAEDTAAFEPRQFQDFIEQKTKEDGTDLGPLLGQLFEVLDTPEDKRNKNLDEQVGAFRYVNGQLFAKRFGTPSFTGAMRESLLEACALDWAGISPAIFGSLFQSIKDRKERRKGGEHYTTEENILKALHPLFLDKLQAELQAAGKNRKKLEELHTKLATIKILDPACGCGNFLVVAYRELRLLELEILKRTYTSETRALDVTSLVRVNVDQFYGIEIEEFPSQIAQVALWLTDHQMNQRVGEALGQAPVRLPLKTAPHIVHDNALTIDWADVVKPQELSYIVGNPPFVGKSNMDTKQKSALLRVFDGTKNAGNLDFVSAWYRKAAGYMAANPAIRAALVSTNSITQGEQVGILWPDLFERGVKINFAHRTFQWSSEARGKAAVHCVIIGFALQDEPKKLLFDYDTPQSEPHLTEVKQINPYLYDGDSIFLNSRRNTICPAPEMQNGGKPTEGGNLLLDEDEKNSLINSSPIARKWIRPFLMGEEFINGIPRFCLWLVDAPASEIRNIPEIYSRIENVREMRLNSSKIATQKLAQTPMIFGEVRQPNSKFYLAIPKVSSERRYYIPIGYLPNNVICGDKLFFISDASLYAFGILMSVMHMAWTRTVCGRLKSDYSYSNTIVYNNFPWPEAPTAKQKEAIEKCAQAVLDARAAHPGSTLADLYDPNTMPVDLLKAHQALDKAVDAAYGAPKFASEAERVKYLFALYQKLTAPLGLDAPAPKKKRTKKAE